jgi:trehalose operon repressor, B. subtilis-type
MNKFNEIFIDLKNKILDDTFLPGTMLPSEKQLMDTYKVSRETVRKALNLLINSGYIQKKQGKGSFVLDFHKFDFPVSSITSYKELQKMQQITSKTSVVRLEVKRADTALATRTGWKKDSEIWELVRTRKIDGEAVILDKDFLLKTIIPELPLSRAEDSIYDYFENDLGLIISYAQKEITVEAVTDEDKKFMDIGSDTHVVVIRSIVCLDDTTCFEYTESRHRLDKFRFIDFARR